MPLTLHLIAQWHDLKSLVYLSQSTGVPMVVTSRWSRLVGSAENWDAAWPRPPISYVDLISDLTSAVHLKPEAGCMTFRQST